MEKIAIIGLSCLFPGAKNGDEFWNNLMEKKDTRSRATEYQMGHSPDTFFWPEKGKTDKYYCNEGGFIQDFKMDFHGFDVPQDALKNLDDVYLWSLYVAREALKDSGYFNKKKILENCGTVLANLSFPTKSSNHFFIPLYHKAVEDSLKELFNNNEFKLAPFSSSAKLEYINGLLGGYPAALISKALNLSDTYFTIDAACASSIYSVKLACDYLLSGKRDLMLAGAVSGADPFFINFGFSIFQAYPEVNGSKPFDRNSQGLIAGEGAGMFVLKRLGDAIRDKDKIYATISGIGLSNDGKGHTVLTPNPKGQILAYERAYHNSEIDPENVSYIECHATGTPVGDKIELSSIKTFFNKYKNSPPIGSVKSNLGHQLTVAGMASMIKVIYALSKETIPATINITNGLDSGKNEILKETKKWPGNHSVKYAAVSGFGFGGTNGHVIFRHKKQEEYTLSEINEQKDYKKIMDPLAIVAMESHFGSCDGLYKFHDSIYHVRQLFAELPENRWKGIDKYRNILKEYGFDEGNPPRGAFIEKFDIDFLRYKIPPNKADRLISQQSLTIKIADMAIKASNIKEGENVAVLIAMGTEPCLHRFRGRINLETQIEESLKGYGALPEGKINNLKEIIKESINSWAKVNRYTSFIGNIMASRISSLWDFSGPSFTVSSEENSVFKGVEIAQMMLSNNEVDAVVLGAIDLSGSVENVLLRNLYSKVNTKGSSFSFDKNSNGWMIGEGSGAVVLKRVDKAYRDNEFIYASIDSVGFSKGKTAESVSRACQRALESSGINASDVEYIEVHGSGYLNEDQIEIDGLNRVYGNSDCTIGCVKSNIGHTFTASGMAGIIKTAICINNGYIPGTPVWHGFKTDLNSHLFVSGETEKWEKSNKKRVAAVNCIGQDDICSHLIISGENRDKKLNIPEKEVQLTDENAFINTVYPGGVDIGAAILTEENRKQFKNIQIKKRLKESPEIYVEQRKEQGEVKEIQQTYSVTEENGYDENVFDFKSYHNNLFFLNNGHSTFLDTRKTGMEQMGEMIKIQLDMLEGYDPSEKRENVIYREVNEALVEYIPEIEKTDEPEVKEIKIRESNEFKVYTNEEISRLEPYSRELKPPGIIWDYNDLHEYACGKISNVFGEEFKIVDTYKRWVRLPMPPYLLVSRVTKLDGKTGEFKPSSMTTEYDIPHCSWYGIDGQIPWAVAVESGQCDLLLISYLGIDFQNKGIRVYRLLDCTLTFVEDIAMEGDTLRYDIKINSFARSGENFMFFFNYNCYVGDKKVLIMEDGCAGFFTDEELEAGKGVIHSEQEIVERKKIKKSGFKPFLTCSKREFNREDLLQITNKNLAACFGLDYDQHGLNPSLRFAQTNMLMIDRIVSIDIKGGAWGLGEVVAEKFLAPDHWYFSCHFKDDNVMAGSLMAEGCGQLVQFFLLYIGLQTQTKDARFQPILNLPQKVRCRGQVIPKDTLLTYKMVIMETGLEPEPYAIANIDIYLEDKISVDFKNLGVRLSEKKPDDPYKIDLPEKNGKDLSFESLQLNEKDKHALYTGCHLENFSRGSIVKCFRPHFEAYHDHHTPRIPNGDLQLITRVLEVTGEYQDFKNPMGIVAEYEVNEDEWFYTRNSNPAVMPYSILMEVALQPCGFLASCMGTTLLYPEMEYYFRNLDGRGNLIKDIDLRGKTITNKSRQVSTSVMGNTIIQSFEFEIFCENDKFYEGTSIFGFFIESALKDQIGLDKGANTHPMTEKKYIDEANGTFFDLSIDKIRNKYFKSRKNKPNYCLASEQLEFLNKDIFMVEKGGRENLGYLYAERINDSKDWFFKCYFFEDPVMAGSFGVEAMIQKIQLFIIHHALGKKFREPKFTHAVNKTTWTYQGQINPHVKKVFMDVHITDIEDQSSKII